MNAAAWEEWLAEVPDREEPGFAERMHQGAERFDCDLCEDMTAYCVQLTTGDVPRIWLQESLDTISACCMDEGDARELLAKLYEYVCSS